MTTWILSSRVGRGVVFGCCRIRAFFISRISLEGFVRHVTRCSWTNAQSSSCPWQGRGTWKQVARWRLVVSYTGSKRIWAAFLTFSCRCAKFAPERRCATSVEQPLWFQWNPSACSTRIGTFGSAGVVGNDHLNVKMEGFVETDCQPICCIGSVACCAPIAVGLCRVLCAEEWNLLTRKLYVFENIHEKWIWRSCLLSR